MEIANLNNFKQICSLRDLLGRVRNNSRASWKDISSSSGVYVVSLKPPITFSSTSLSPMASTERLDNLRQKMHHINSRSQTDIVYIGKAVNLRVRISRLIRFGAGKTNRHKGGEWMWQIVEVENSCLHVLHCNKGKEGQLENKLLKSFYQEHGEYPLANRRGEQLA